MKAKFKCYKCNKENDYEGEANRLELFEARSDFEIHIIACRWCGAENRVRVKRIADE